MATVPKLDDDQLKQINEHAERWERSPTDILREAVSDYFSRERDSEEERWRDAMNGWEEYQRTGLHITGEELFAWLRTCGTDAETEFPECHT